MHDRLKLGWLVSVILIGTTPLLSQCSNFSSDSATTPTETEETTTPSDSAASSPTQSPVASQPSNVETAETTAATETSVAPIFEDILPEIQANAEIPILLPARVPLPEEQVYVDGGANADTYQIHIGFAPNCRATACFVGFFAGREGSGDYYETGEEFSETVPLANGVTGYYNPMQCGASCAPPVIEWEWQGVRYRFELKGAGGNSAEDKAAMVQLANSAIAAGGR